MKLEIPKLDFFTDFNKDKYFIKKFFPRVREVFGEKMFNNFFLRKYYPNTVGKNDEELIKFFERNKNKIFKQTEKDGGKLEKKWSKMNDKFFKQVEQITGFRWKYKKYRCHLSSTFICGGCYDAKAGNFVSVFPSLKHADPLEVIIHELIHLHFWDTLDRLKIKYDKNEKLQAEGKFWDLSEVAVNYPMTKLKIRGFKYTFKIYQQHKKLWNKIKPFWKKDFESFIKESVKVIE